MPAEPYSERPSRLPDVVAWRRLPSAGSPAARILPDGCLDLIWTGVGLIVAGPDTVAQVVRPGAGPTAHGLRFGPGLGPALLGVPAAELRDQRVRLDQVWQPARARRAEELVSGAGNRAAALEALAAELLPGAEPDPLLRRVVDALRRGVPVAATAEGTGLTERTLHRRCLAAFGYGPKTLSRILRLQRAVQAARSGRPPARVAADTGYADQAHLAREVKALAGVPLGELLQAGP